MFNSIFTTFPFFVSLFWGVVLFIDNFYLRNRAKMHLTVFMFSAAFLYFCHCLYFNEEKSLFILYDSLYSFSSLAVYPLYYIYILSLTQGTPLKYRQYHMLIPSVVFGLSSLIVTLCMTPDQLAWYIDNIAYTKNSGCNVPFALGRIHYWMDKVQAAIFAIQIVPLVILGMKKISKYDRDIKNYYSDINNKTLSSISRLVVYIVLASVCSVGVNFVGRQFFNYSGFFMIPSIIFGCLIFAIGYIGSKKEFIALDFVSEMTSDEDAIEKPTKTPDDFGNQDFSKVIIDLIIKKKLYKRPDIKVSDLTAMLHTNRTYVYRAINKDLNTSFSELINHYRVECAKEMISASDGGKINMQDIIFSSGFSSESSFYRIFKHATGYTPNQWYSLSKNQS